MKSQQLKAFIHSYTTEQKDEETYSLRDFMEQYSKHFGIDISYLETDNYYIRLFKDFPLSEGKQEITFATLLRGIEQGYMDNNTVNLQQDDPELILKQKFTTKQIIVGIVLILISSALLSVIAFYA